MNEDAEQLVTILLENGRTAASIEAATSIKEAVDHGRSHVGLNTGERDAVYAVISSTHSGGLAELRLALIFDLERRGRPR
jgi:alkylhydroperoxidase family enzyme